MKHLHSLRLTWEIAVRMIADALMVNGAVLSAFIAHFSYKVMVEHVTANTEVFFWIWRSYVRCYIGSAWLLTLICLVVFTLSGFYTYGRAYIGHYKRWIVIQSTSLSYLIFCFLLYAFNGAVTPGGSAWVLAWLLSVCALVAARAWSLLWRNLVLAERQLVKLPEKGKVRNVLIIGGAGYIGSALLPKLLEKDYRVRLLDLLLYGTEPIRNLLGHPHLEVMHADFRQVDRVVEAMSDMDAVIHLGAIVGDSACALNKELTIEVNLMATRMIAEVAKGSAVGRFLFASTCSVYGGSKQILDEYSQLNPVSLYARTKIASERMLMSMATASFAPTCLRFSTIYGLSGRTRFDLVINLLTAKGVVDGVITVFNGNQWRPFLHVEDAALGVLKSLEAPLNLVRDQIFNVGSNDQNYTIREAGEIIHGLLPTAKLVSGISGADQRNYRVDFSKIHRTLGFVPQWTIEQGVQQVINIIRSGAVKDYRDAKYSNAKFLTEEGSARMRCVNGWADDLIDQSSSRYRVLVEATGEAV